jgi:hypothetical protein
MLTPLLRLFVLNSVLWNRIDLIWFRFRFRKSFGSDSGSGSGSGSKSETGSIPNIAVFQLIFYKILPFFMLKAALFPRKLASHF